MGCLLRLEKSYALFLKSVRMKILESSKIARQHQGSSHGFSFSYRELLRGGGRVYQRWAGRTGAWCQGAGGVCNTVILMMKHGL